MASDLTDWARPNARSGKQRRHFSEVQIQDASRIGGLGSSVLGAFRAPPPCADSAGSESKAHVRPSLHPQPGQPTNPQSLTRPTLTQAPRFGLVNGLGGLRSNGCYGCNGLRVCDLRQVSGLAIGVWACRTSTRVIGIGMDWGLCRQLWARAPAEEKAHGNLERIFRHVPRHRCCLKKIVTTGGSKHNNTKTAERAAFCKQKKDCSPW